MQDKVILFEKLSKKDLVYEEKIVKFKNFFGKSGDNLFNEIFEPTYQEFRDWLTKLLENEPLHPTIQGINFGLFETIGGFEVYLSGSNVFSYDDPDWACTNDYWPEGRYAKLSTYDDITERLEELSIEPWKFIQAMTILFIDKFLREDNTKKLIPEHIRVASGFDDGDLYYIER